MFRCPGLFHCLESVRPARAGFPSPVRADCPRLSRTRHPSCRTGCPAAHFPGRLCHPRRCRRPVNQTPGIPHHRNHPPHPAACRSVAACLAACRPAPAHRFSAAPRRHSPTGCPVAVHPSADPWAACRRRLAACRLARRPDSSPARFGRRRCRVAAASSVGHGRSPAAASGRCCPCCRRVVCHRLDPRSRRLAPVPRHRACGVPPLVTAPCPCPDRRRVAGPRPTVACPRPLRLHPLGGHRGGAASAPVAAAPGHRSSVPAIR